MPSLSTLLHGRRPRALSLLLIYGVGGATAAYVWQLGPGGIAGVVLAVLALDWAGGVVSNSTASTRAAWAELPRWAVLAFVAVHLAEIAPLWWLAPPSLFWPLLGILILKLSVFIIGNNDLRKDSSP